MKKTIVRIEISILIAVLIVNVFSFVGFSKQCDEIRNKVLRMHVIANSDENYDQELKLKVRDAVLNEGRELFDGSLTADDAEEKIIPNIERLEKIALKTIKDEGYDYDVKIYVVNEFFDAFSNNYMLFYNVNFFILVSSCFLVLLFTYIIKASYLASNSKAQYFI